MGEVVFEPDGQVPPDFLIDSRIAVEARRLNQHEKIGTGHRGLEETSFPLHAAVKKILREQGPPLYGHSWLVSYSFRRPLPPWKEVERLLREGLREFVAQLDNPPDLVRVGRQLRLQFFRASRNHTSLFVIGGSSDRDAGGFIIAEVIENINLCVAEKQRKVEPYSSKYPEWWLALEDLISLARLDADEVSQVREHVRVQHDFARIILVDPLEPARAVCL